MLNRSVLTTTRERVSRSSHYESLILYEGFISATSRRDREAPFEVSMHIVRWFLLYGKTSYDIPEMLQWEAGLVVWTIPYIVRSPSQRSIFRLRTRGISRQGEHPEDRNILTLGGVTYPTKQAHQGLLLKVATRVEPILFPPSEIFLSFVSGRRVSTNRFISQKKQQQQKRPQKITSRPVLSVGRVGADHSPCADSGIPRYLG